MRKNTKVLFLVLAMTLIGSIFAISAFAEIVTGTCGDNASYTLNTETGILSIDGSGRMESFASYSPAPWHEYRSYIKKANISDGIESIGEYAFFECNEMTSISLPESLLYISSYAFDQASALTSLTIPKNVESIDSWVFRGCSSLKAINVDPFNEYFQDINGILFSKSESVLLAYPGGGEEKYTVPEGTLSIDQYAFYECATIKEITLPESVKDIGSRVFSHCPFLTKIYVNSSNDTFYDINGVLFSKEDNTLLVCPSGISGAYTVPAKAKNIGEFAFYSCEKLTSVTVSEGVERIEQFAFDDCINLISLSFPDSLTHIGGNVISGSAIWHDETKWDGYALYIGNHLIDMKYEGPEELEIKEGTKTIASDACKASYYLKKVTIPSSVNVIGSSAFSNCINLEEILISEGVTTIEENAFSNCSSLKSISLPDSVTYLGYCVFESCSGLSDIKVGNNITYIGHNVLNGTSYYSKISNWDYENVLYLGNYLIEAKKSINYAYIAKDETKLIANNAFKNCKELASIVLPYGLVTIGNNAFSRCKSLENINIPASVNYIGDFAFDDCSSLPKISLSDNITTIGSYTFSGCSNLKSINIPNSVTSIGEYAFYGCEELEEVSLGNKIKKIAPYVFNCCSKLKSIIVPESVTVIGESAFSACESLTSVTLGKNVKYIESDAFGYCYNLKKITLGSSLTKIGDGSFSYCASIEEIRLPASLTKIGNRAFENCTGLKSITVPDLVSKLGDYAFSNCESLNGVILGSNLTSISEMAFYNCTSLKTVKIPSSVKSIESSAFSYCQSLENIIIPNSVTKIGSFAFSDCTALCGITIGSAVKSIECSAFYSCYSIRSIIIPKSVTHIGDMAFAYCSGIENITFKGDSTIDDDAFYDCYSLSTIYLYKDSNADDFFSNDEYTKIYFDDDPSTEKIHFEYTVNAQNEVTIKKYIGKGGEVLIPEKIDNKNVTVIGSGAFEWLQVNVTKIVIPSTVKTIKSYAFHDCSSLTDITIPNGVTTIENSAFALCPMLQSITLPASIDVLEESIFMGCVMLEEIKVDAKNKKYCDIDGVLFSKDKSTLIAYPAGKDLNYSIPEGTVKIGETAFVSCASLNSVSIPRSVSEIGDNSFAYCSALEKIFVFKNSFSDIFFSSTYYSDILQYFTEYEEGNIKVETKSEDGFAEGAILIAVNVPEAELGDFVISNDHGKNPDLVAYDISFEIDGNEVQPNSLVTVRIKVPNNFNGRRCKVYHYSEDGSITDMEADYVDGYMVFNTDHFSIYVLADMPTSKLGDVNGDGKIGIKDAVLLAQHLAKWNVEIDMLAADLNADGSVNILDIVLLVQYLAGWNVTLS